MADCGHVRHSLPCWSRNVSKGKQTDLILLDFSKAFDKVNHSKLLWKLHQFGIRGHALAWIRAFLGNRSQTVVLDGEESESVPVTSGVPQGSVLGPILFLIYINDLPDELSSQVRLFADDTAVYLTIGDTEDGKVLQNDLDRLSVYERLPITHWSALSWSMSPQFGTHTLRRRYSSWKKYNAGQHAGPPVITTTGQALLPLLITLDGERLNYDGQMRV